MRAINNTDDTRIHEQIERLLMRQLLLVMQRWFKLFNKTGTVDSLRFALPRYQLLQSLRDKETAWKVPSITVSIALLPLGSG